MINFNGQLISLDTIHAEEFERSYKYGDAVFETMKVSNGKILFLEDHYFRLTSSMRILRMDIPMSFTMEFFQSEANKLAEKLELTDGRLRLQVMRKSDGRYTPIGDVSVAWWMELEPIDSRLYSFHTDGLKMELFKDHYIQPGLLSTLKTSNSLPYILAGIYAKENLVDSVFLVNDRKMLVEANQGNVFLLQGNVLKTPPLEDGALRGILRKNILKWASELGLDVKEGSINPFDLQKCDEIWVTNVIQGIQWVGEYRKRKYTSAKAQEMIELMNRKLRVLEIL